MAIGLSLSSLVGAQNITVSGALSGNGSYATLQAAFAALNAGNQLGAAVVVDVVNSTTETASAVLNAGQWTSVVVRPSGGAARSISGAIAGGNALIYLNGADFVTIDGLNTGGNSLTLTNTSTSGSLGTSTVRMENDAKSNTVTRCTVQGSSASSSCGTIFIGTGTVDGNDNNTISFCTIRPAGANLHRVGVLGSGGFTGPLNSGITVTGCTVQDYFATNNASYGINAEEGNENWTITDNRLYQTATRSVASFTVVGHYPIRFHNASPTLIISGNTIGYSAADGTGIYRIQGPGSAWFGAIYIGTGALGTATVSNNTVTAIGLSGRLQTDDLQGPFHAILVASGTATCTGNLIGSQSATGAITITNTDVASSEIRPIYNYGSQSWTVSNNTIGGITMDQTSPGTMVFSGIKGPFTASSGASTISGNTIGGTVAGSISNLSNSLTSGTSGIVLVSGNCGVTDNVIRNFTASTGSGPSDNPATGGIICKNASYNHTVTGNVISGFSCTAPNAGNKLIGIYFQSANGTNLVERNRISGFSSLGNFTMQYGIEFGAGTATFANNMIALGAGVTAGCEVYGLLEIASGTHTVLHNSVYIGGTATTGSESSCALRSATAGNTRDYRNNILVNARTNAGSTGKHYAISTDVAPADLVGLTSDHNVLRVTGTGSFTGRFNGTDLATLTDWRSATGHDLNSLTGDPFYLAPTAAIPDLHIDPLAGGSSVEAAGTASATRTNDFDNEVRSNLTPVDIGADARNPQPACTGTPPAGTISGSSPICSGSGTTLGFSTGSSASGFTYQWALSTSPGGPFNTLLGTASTQATGTLTSTRYYRVTTTCNGSGLTNNSLVFTLQVNSTQVGATCDDGDPNTVNDVVVAPCGCAGAYVLLNLHVVLEGPLVVGQTLMRDEIRSLPGFPLSQPYSALGVGTITGSGGPLAGSVLTVSGNNAIVDWILVELRDAASGTTVAVRTPALLQRDGDVVGVDGTSLLRLPIAAGNYRIAVRHRNHLGVMTASPIALSTSATSVDLSVPGTATYGTDARKNVNGVYALWAGDVTFNGQLKYTGSGNDRDPILIRVGSTTPNSTVSGYWGEDVTMDGAVKYTGTGNDRDPILVNVGSTTPNSIRVQQLP